MELGSREGGCEEEKTEKPVFHNNPILIAFLVFAKPYRKDYREIKNII
jgi:hypothetical protein